MAKETKSKKTAPKKVVKVQPIEVFCHSKYIRISPSKLRRVANLVRGKHIGNAEAILKSLTHKGAVLLLKSIMSAKANAINNHEKSAGQLVVSTLTIDEGPKFKRFRARARGRVSNIEKKFAHINVGVRELEEQK